MTPPAGGAPRRRHRLRAALRGFGMMLAVGLGAVAVWLIVTAETEKWTRIGALVGFWALLLAAYALFGTRRPLPALAQEELVSRPGTELTRGEDAAARREYEYRLMEMLRRELTATMSAELVTLRADVAALRGELVEKVGGQIRLERIETTRVIGSDIEALQHEVRQMLGGRQPDQLGQFSLGGTHASLVASSEQPAREQLMSEPLGPQPVGPVPGPPAPPAPPAPVPPEPIAPQPPLEPIAPPTPAPAPIAPQPPAPVPAPDLRPPVPTAAEPVLSGDPFASMPRLRPFTDFEIDPIETRPRGAQATPRRQSSVASTVNGSSESGTPSSGRHTNAHGETHNGVAPGTSGGRRRRAADGDDDDVLARILSREAAR